MFEQLWEKYDLAGPPPIVSLLGYVNQSIIPEIHPERHGEHDYDSTPLPPGFPLPPGWQMKAPIKTPCRRNLRPIPPDRRNLTQGMQPKTPAQAGRRESDEPVFLRSERCKWEAPSVIV